MSRHATDVLSLAFGLLFVSIGVVLFTGWDFALSVAWVGPVIAIALGALVILAARASMIAPSDARDG